MNIIISNTSDKPIYQQLFDQISSQIVKADLVCNELLPSIRTVAKELRISVITVKKAWEELERIGFIYTVIGKGSFVAELNKAELIDKRDELVIKTLKKDISHYKELGLSIQELTGFIKKYY